MDIGQIGRIILLNYIYYLVSKGTCLLRGPLNIEWLSSIQISLLTKNLKGGAWKNLFLDVPKIDITFN